MALSWHYIWLSVLSFSSCLLLFLLDVRILTHTQSLQVPVLVIALIFIIFHKCIVLWHFPLITKMWSLSWVTDDNLGEINTKNLPGHITCKNAHTCRGLYWRSTQFLYQLNGISFLESYVVSIYLQSVFILYLDA